LAVLALIIWAVGARIFNGEFCGTTGYPDCPSDKPATTPVTPKQTADPYAKIAYVPLTDHEIVLYASDWTKDSKDCVLLTGRSPVKGSHPTLDLSKARMGCGNIPIADAPQFTTKILLDKAAWKAFSQSTKWMVNVACADKLEANGALMCNYGKVPPVDTADPEATGGQY
jgi:hypothetical protein